MGSYAWTLNANGYWSTASDWSPSGPPTAGADVTIDTASFHTITLNSGTYSIAGLTLGNDELLISGGSALHVTGSFTNTGTALIQSGLLDLSGGGTLVPGNFEIATTGTLSFASGTIAGGTLGGRVELNGAIYENRKLTITDGLQDCSPHFNGTGKIHLEGVSNVYNIFSAGVSLENSGTLNALPGGFIDFVGENYAGAAINLGQDTLLYTNSINAGLITSDTSQLDGTLTNVGTFMVDAGTSCYSESSDFINTGLIEVLGGGALSLQSGASSPEHIQVAPTGTIKFIENTFTLTSGTLTGNAQLDGTISEAGTLAVAGPFATNTAEFSDQGAFTGGGLILIENTSTFYGLIIEGGEIVENKSTSSIAGVTFTHGTLVNDAGATLDLLAGGFIEHTSAPSEFVNAGTIANTIGLYTSTIAVDFQTTGVITVADGTLEFNGPDNTFSGTIQGPGTLWFGGGANSITAGTALTVGAVLESGIGTTLQLAESLTLSNLTQDPRATLVLGRGTLGITGAALLAGTVSGTGTLASSGSTTLATGASLGQATVALDAGSLTVAAPRASIGHLLDDDATIAIENGGDLTLSGPARLAGGTISGPGELITRGTVGLSGLALLGGASWTDAGVVDATGTLALGGTSGSTGTLAIDQSAVFDLVGDGRIMVARGGKGGVDNSGTLEKTAGQKLSVILPAVDNSGSIIVSSGTLALGAAVSGTGTAMIDAASTLGFVGSVAATQTVTFAGADATLGLLDITAFKAAIEGFDQASSGDQIVVTTFGAGTTIAFSQPVSGEVVATLTNGSSKASITLFGQYSTGGFSYTTAASGTVISYAQPAATPTTLANLRH